LARFGHVGQVVADFQLEQRNRSPQVAIAVVVPIKMPPHASAHQIAGIFDNRIRGVMMRLGVEQAFDIRHHGRPVEQCEKERIIVENVENAGAVVAFKLRHASVRKVLLLLGAPPFNDAAKRSFQLLNMIWAKKIFQYQIAIVIKEEALIRCGLLLGFFILCNHLLSDLHSHRCLLSCFALCNPMNWVICPTLNSLSVTQPLDLSNHSFLVGSKNWKKLS